MNKNDSHYKSKKPFIKGMVVFFIVIILTQTLAYQKYIIAKNTLQNEILNEINSIEDRLQLGLNNGLAATKTLAFIIEKDGTPKDFDRIAKTILESNKNIDALQLTKGGVITNTYPLKGNEIVIGFNILEDSKTKKEALKAIEKKELFFAGPFELKQGGMAIVGRLPVFINNKFDGFSVVIINLPTLLKVAGIDSLKDNPFIYQLSKINPSTLEREYFLSSSIDMNKATSASITMPFGDLELHVASKKKTPSYDVIAFSIIGFILSLIAGIFAWYSAVQPEKLNQLVLKKTDELTKAEYNFKTTLARVSDAIIALDKDWRYTYINEGALASHPLGIEQTLGKVIWDVHPEIKETIFGDTYQEAMLTKKTMEIESFYAPLNSWFLVKVYPSDDGLTIFYRDITLQHLAQQELIDNENRLAYAQEVAKIGSWETNLSDFSVIWSKETFRIFELSSESDIASHKAFLEFVHPDDREKVDAAFIFSLSSKEMNLVEHRIITAKGNIKQIEERWRIVHDKDGNPIKAMGTAQDITDRKNAEEKIKESEKQLRQLSAHLQIVREEERTNIAREIHDELGQQLTALKMDASWIQRKITTEDPLVQQRLSDMILLISDGVKTIRRISSELRPGILDDLGLAAAIEWQGQEFEKRSGFQLKLHTFLNDLKLDRNLETNIFRIYQEALTNVSRHANANLVEVWLERKDHNILLIIKDNGEGFEKDLATKKSWGIVGMKERALILNGELNIHSEKTKGTIITLTVPIA